MAFAHPIDKTAQTPDSQTLLLENDYDASGSSESDKESMEDDPVPDLPDRLGKCRDGYARSNGGLFSMRIGTLKGILRCPLLGLDMFVIL